MKQAVPLGILILLVLAGIGVWKVAREMVPALRSYEGHWIDRTTHAEVMVETDGRGGFKAPTNSGWIMGHSDVVGNEWVVKAETNGSKEFRFHITPSGDRNHLRVSGYGNEWSLERK